jgi:hypothetical protein
MFGIFANKAPKREHILKDLALAQFQNGTQRKQGGSKEAEEIGGPEWNGAAGSRFEHDSHFRTAQNSLQLGVGLHASWYAPGGTKRAGRRW